MHAALLRDASQGDTSAVCCMLNPATRNQARKKKGGVCASTTKSPHTAKRDTNQQALANLPPATPNSEHPLGGTPEEPTDGT